MKTILSVLTTLCLLILITTSCEQDKCAEVNCLNDGICVEGTCECPNGYEGMSCETETREKLIGSYTYTAVCNTGNFGPTPAIIRVDDNDALKVWFDIQYASDTLQRYALMTTDTTFNFPAQTPLNSGLPCSICIDLSGTGSIDVSTGIVTTDVSFTSGETCTDTYTPL